MNVLGNVFGNMFKKDPKTVPNQPFLGQTTSPEQSGIMGQINKWNPFVKGGKKQTKQSKQSKQRKTKKNKK